MDRKSAVLVTLGFEIVGFIAVAIFLGNYLDDRFKWGGVGVMVCIGVAFVGWLVHLLVAVRQLDNDDKSGDTTPK